SCCHRSACLVFLCALSLRAQTTARPVTLPAGSAGLCDHISDSVLPEPDLPGAPPDFFFPGDIHLSLEFTATGSGRGAPKGIPVGSFSRVVRGSGLLHEDSPG